MYQGKGGYKSFDVVSPDKNIMFHGRPVFSSSAYPADISLYSKSATYHNSQHIMEQLIYFSFSITKVKDNIKGALSWLRTKRSVGLLSKVLFSEESDFFFCFVNERPTV